MMDAAHELAASRRFLTLADVDAIQALVRAIPRVPAVVVDLGAGSGTTALSVLCERPEAIVVTTVDMAVDALHWAQAAISNTGFDDGIRWRPVLATAAAVAGWWQRPVDLLLHDAGHEYDDVLRDLEAWLPHLRPGARVWVHDYAPPPADWGARSYPGVAQALLDLMAAGALIEMGTAGLGWWGRKP